MTNLHHGTRPRWRRAALSVAAALATTTALLAASNRIASANDPVIVFYTICEKTPGASTANDNVIVKRVNEDGTNAVTIGDTGIPACRSGADTNTFLSGFAVAGEYGYYSWFNWDGTGAGIGRIRLDGTATAEKSFITAPASTRWLQMSPTSVGGYLYAYVDNGIANNAYVESRIARVATSGGSFSTVISPVATEANADSFSFGVGKTGLFFSTSLYSSKRLERVDFDGTNRTTFYDFAAGPQNDPTTRAQFLTGRGANLVAESDSKIFLYDQVMGVGQDPPDVGISTINTSSADGTRAPFAAVPSASGQPPAQAIVWGGNFLYFKDGDGFKMGRTTADGTGRNMDVFPTLMTGGYLHHISPAKASTVTVTTTTTTTSTTTTTTTTTTTVAPTTTVAAPTVPKKGGLQATRIASFAKLTVPKGSKVGLKVAAPSRRVCAVRSGRLVALGSGNCRVTVTVSPRTGKSKRSTVTLKTS